MKLEYSVAQFRANTREILNSVDMGAEVVIKRYENKYRLAPFLTYGIDPAQPGADKTVEMVVKDGQVVKEGELVSADKVAPKKNARLASQKNKSVKPPAGIAPVDSCPHGYAKGFCKKADCNRRYQK